MNELKERIAAAAHELFTEHGPEGVSMRKIAQQVGVTAPAIYRHYKDKGELLDGIINDGLEKLQSRLAPALEAATPLERLRRMGDAYLDFAIEQPTFFDYAFMTPKRSSGSISEELQRHDRRIFRHAIEQVTHCIHDGTFGPSDPIEVAIRVWSTVHGLITLFRTGRLGLGDDQFRETYRRTVDQMLADLRPRND
ncbi:MAG: TetR/AcrR family transcriptional regulator [Acidobacteriota bacterium]|nr:TetR/AcrR family transcriptional regulator [Acidobacteriota bacterium]MDH3785334.1 TetR/AcrR family transcriptional regulator [Acidobacteriota bacterium]